VALAGSLGLRVPFTVVLEDEAQARQAAAAAPYPVVLKPRFSAEPSASGGVRVTGGPAYARTPEQLLEAYRHMTRRCRAVLLQEFVAGEGAGYFALMQHGTLLAEFAHRRLRDVRPTGSGSSVRESVPVPAGLRRAALAMLGALGWQGVAMVEFRVRPDGTPVFMEVNGRFWNSLALAVRAGIDFPRLLVDMTTTRAAACPESYRPGVRCRWLLGDLRHLAEVWRGAPAGYPSRFPGRLRTLAEFLRPVPGTFHDNFQLDDPLPELGDWLDFALNRVWPALRRRDPRDLLHVQRRYSHP
jgi:predicted ATP-grasp superfamily ATP-dependent carboligase